MQHTLGFPHVVDDLSYRLRLSPSYAVPPRLRQVHQPGDQQPHGQVVRRVAKALRRRLLTGCQTGALHHLHR